VAAFQSLSYEVCETAESELEYQKVAIYVRDRQPKHMALQLQSGEWTSKCGPLEDITHPLDALEGDTYGSVVKIMRRPLT
jgi:hypothetical protein